MPQVSRFSTADNFQKLTTALEQAKAGLAEAELAKQAGLPEADQLVTTAKEAVSRIQQLLNTYFPEGTAPA